MITIAACGRALVTAEVWFTDGLGPQSFYLGGSADDRFDEAWERAWATE